MLHLHSIYAALQKERHMSGALIFSGVIRPLTQEDAGQFLAHLSRLDAQSRHDRFHGAIGRL